jgi:archaeal flagellar protein FlaJ
MEIKKMHWLGIVAFIILVTVDITYFLFQDNLNLFLFLLGLSIGILVFPFVVGVVLDNRKEREMTEMFLEFSRNLAESVSTGTPISKSIVNVRGRNYGELTPHVNKLANQISLGVPVGNSLETFSKDVGSSVISRAVGLIREAERAGGEIDYILSSVARSIAEVDKLRKERRASVSSLIVQGYIIFFIFIGIMLVMQFHILPLVGNAGIFGQFDFQDPSTLLDNGAGSDSGFDVNELARPFLFLLLAQGILVGLTIGKLAEGNIKSGFKHSFILAISAFLISSGANLFIG